MADDVDRATDHMEVELAARIRDARAKPEAELDGLCANCAEPARPGSRFCCRECLEDHEARERQRIRSGGA